MTHEKGFSVVNGKDVKDGAITVLVSLDASAGEARLIRTRIKQIGAKMFARINASRSANGKAPRSLPAKKTTVTNMTLSAEAVNGNLFVQLPVSVKSGDKIFWDAYGSVTP